MLDVPPHLFQPLNVDTNIIYDLDMSKFPGLNDPQQMYQPALLIATNWNWNNYVYDDNTTDLMTCGDVFEENLFELIESCNDMFPKADSFGDVEVEIIQSFFDDVIADTEVPSEEPDLTNTSNEIKQPSATPVDTDKNVELYLEELSPLSSSSRRQKRSRSDDSDYHNTKRSKMTDIVSLQLPPLVTVCRTSSNSVLHRDS